MPAEMRLLSTPVELIPRACNSRRNSEVIINFGERIIDALDVVVVESLLANVAMSLTLVFKRDIFLAPKSQSLFAARAEKMRTLSTPITCQFISVKHCRVNEEQRANNHR
jgi:hypothetical protein